MFLMSFYIVGDGQGGLACYDSWGCKELDTTERLNFLVFVQRIQMSCVKKSIKVKNRNVHKDSRHLKVFAKYI